MRVRLFEIGDQPFTWRSEGRIVASSLERSELLELGPVVWSGQITRLETGYLLRARVAYHQTLACQRCLAPVTEAVSEEVELLLLEHEPGAEEEERELEQEDLGVVVVGAREELDLNPVLLEQIQLNVPMRPLCAEACAGLCPTCGADLNEGECRCGPAPADPRWSGLAAIRDRLAGSDGD